MGHPARTVHTKKGHAMSRRTTPVSTVDDQESTVDVSTTPEGWEWETVVDESPTLVIFDTVGDVFIGQYKGEEHIDQPVNEKGEDQSFDRYIFRGTDGQPYAINKSYKLAEAMSKVDTEDWCRITYVKDIPTNRKLNPLKDFRVDVRRK